MIFAVVLFFTAQQETAVALDCAKRAATQSMTSNELHDKKKSPAWRGWSKTRE